MNKRIMSKIMKFWYGVLILLLAGAVGVAQASSPTAASATFTQTAITSFEIRFAGPNVIFEQTTVGSVSGTLSGSYEEKIRVVIHPNGHFNAQGIITCECTVEGKSGVIELVVVDTGEPVSPTTATFEGSAVITGATGELSGLRGVFEVEGTVDLLTGLSTYTLSGQIHFDP
jgi:hypothetical protein